jgi:hypothetical protein
MIPVAYHLSHQPAGCHLQVIQRAGYWVVDPFTTAYILPTFSPEALMGIAMWAGAAQKDFTGFWAERFCVAVPEELVLLLCPGLRKLEAYIAAERAAMGSSRAARAAPEVDSVLRVLWMGFTAVVQDSLELAPKFPDNSIHRLLMREPSFRCVGLGGCGCVTMGGVGGRNPSHLEACKQHVQLVVYSYS